MSLLSVIARSAGRRKGGGLLSRIRRGKNLNGVKIAPTFSLFPFPTLKKSCGARVRVETMSVCLTVWKRKGSRGKAAPALSFFRRLPAQ